MGAGGATEPLLQPWHGVPGPKEKGTPEFKGRTELLEKSASAPEATGANCSLPASRWSTVQISGAAASSGRRAMYSP